MPIKNLTDRGPDFPIIGHIRKGAPKSEKGYAGKDLKHFRVEFEPGAEDSAELFKSIYGDTPDSIRVWFPFKEIDRVADFWLEAYTGGALIARSDGEFFQYLIDHETGKVIVTNGKSVETGQPVPHVDVVGQYKSQKGQMVDITMKPTGRVKVIIRELQRGAFLMLHTTSIHDVARISAQLEGIANLNGGSLANIPVDLRRVPKQVSRTNPDGSKTRSEKWMLEMEVGQDWVGNLLLDAGTVNVARVLPAGILEPEADDGQDEEYEEEITGAVVTEIPENLVAAAFELSKQLGYSMDEWLAMKSQKEIADVYMILKKQADALA